MSWLSLKSWSSSRKQQNHSNWDVCSDYQSHTEENLEENNVLIYYLNRNLYCCFDDVTWEHHSWTSPRLQPSLWASPAGICMQSFWCCIPKSSITDFQLKSDSLFLCSPQTLTLTWPWPGCLSDGAQVFRASARLAPLSADTMPQVVMYILCFVGPSCTVGLSSHQTFILQKHIYISRDCAQSNVADASLTGPLSLSPYVSCVITNTHTSFCSNPLLLKASLSFLSCSLFILWLLCLLYVVQQKTAHRPIICLLNKWFQACSMSTCLIRPVALCFYSDLQLRQVLNVWVQVLN